MLARDEASVCGLDGQRLETSGDGDAVWDGEPRAAGDAELAAVGDVDVRAVDAGLGVRVGDVAVWIGAAGGRGRAEAGAVAKDVRVALNRGPDPDRGAEQGDGVDLTGLEPSGRPVHLEVRGQRDESDVAFGLDMRRRLGPGGVVERGQDLAEDRFARDQIREAGGADGRPTAHRAARGVELTAVQPDQWTLSLCRRISCAALDCARARDVCSVVTWDVGRAGVHARVLEGPS